MAKSMTGYGRAQGECHGRKIAVEIKSVNSRYFEFSMRLPRNMGFVEEAVKKQVSQRVARGRVEVGLLVQNLADTHTSVQANLPVSFAYCEAISEIASELGIENDTTVSTLLRFPDVFTVTRDEEDEEELVQDVLAITQEALQQHQEMQQLEGAKLVEDVLARLSTLEGHLAVIEKTSAGRVQRYRERLYERLKEVLEDQHIEQARLLQEAALFADKTAVDEETVRLHSHIAQYRDTLSLPDTVGRKLDFLSQELNREVNTIGSKCQEVEITRIVVDMKGEVEKIREQIQNLE